MAAPSTSTGARKITTRILFVSDTHVALDRRSVLPDNLPPADVFVHTGNMASGGRIAEYENVLEQLGAIKAPLKLVIGGSHDLSLDADFYLGRRHEADRDFARRIQAADWDPGCPAQARELLTGPRARAAGIAYLDEGMHEFVLGNGAKLRVYASPWSPEFGRWAFNYVQEENRFDPPELITLGEPFIRNAGWTTKPAGPRTSPKPIPNGAAVDLVMTHSPPYLHMDRMQSENFKNTVPLGCPHLLTAVERVKPKIHAFGHILEGWGAEIVGWPERPPGEPWRRVVRTDKTSGLIGEVKETIGSLSQGIRPTWDVLEKGAAYIDITSTSKRPLDRCESLLLNASLLNAWYKPRPGWLVDVELEPANAKREADSTAGSNVDTETTT